jgi:hypothetical protein
MLGCIAKSLCSCNILAVAATAAATATATAGTVLDIFGAFAASVIGYVLPALLYMKSHEVELTAALQMWRVSDSTGSSNGMMRTLSTDNAASTDCSNGHSATVAAAVVYKPTLSEKLSALKPFYTAGFMALFGAITCVAGTVSTVVAAMRHSSDEGTAALPGN